MRSARHRRAAAVTSVLTAALLACLPVGSAAARDGSGHRDEPSLGRILVNPPTASLVLPFDSITDSSAERRLSDVAQNRLTTRCMARYGVTYARQDPPVVSGPEDRHRYLFGLADPVFAATHGYDRTAGEPRPPRPEQPELDEDAFTALYGHRPGDTPPFHDPLSEEEAQEQDSGVQVNGRTVPVDGCLGEGYRTLYVPTRASLDPTFPFQLAAEAHARAKEDSRLQRVYRLWSRCMERAGYPGIENPYLVQEKLNLWDDPGGPEAIAAAVKDVACKRKVNLVGFGAAVETAYQEQVSTEVADPLAAYRTQRAARLALAATLP
ncbi:hypothetical protein ACFY7C_18960 [Streptomyces sp. NPDC012769]|uniref:hypothetical protein n=1 Tax=Streptomyces sp. NPDC012769 TaxID=3364848 RepID=UPI0036A5C6FD